MLKKIKKNKNRIMSFICVMVMFISICGFTNYTVSASEDTENTVVEYYDSAYEAVLSDVYGVGYFENFYTYENVRISIAQKYSDYANLYYNVMRGFSNNGYNNGLYISELIDDLPIYVPDISGNPFGVENCKVFLMDNGTDTIFVYLVYSVDDVICSLVSSYDFEFTSNSIFYYVSYSVTVSDFNGDGVKDTYTCSEPVSSSYHGAQSCIIDDVKYTWNRAYFKYSEGQHNIIYSDLPVYQEYTSAQINANINGASADSDLTKNELNAYMFGGYSNEYTYLFNDYRPYFYDFSNQETEEEPGDGEESYKNHMYLTSCLVNFSGSDFNVGSVIENVDYDEWIVNNIDNFRLKTQIITSAVLSNGDSSEFKYENYVALSDLSRKTNILYLSDIYEHSYTVVDGQRVFFYNYFSAYGETDLWTLYKNTWSAVLKSFSTGGDIIVDNTSDIYFTSLNFNIQIQLVYDTGIEFEYSSAFLKSYDLLTGDVLDSSDGITINNNPWGGSESSDGTVSGVLGDVTESFNAIVESGAVSLGDVLATIGDITTSSMIESGAISNSVSGGSVTIEEGAISASGGQATIAEGAVNSQGGQASVSEGAVNVTIDNSNEQSSDDFDFGLNNDDVVHSTDDVTGGLVSLITMLLLFTDDSFLEIVNLVFGFLPATVITVMSAVVITIFFVGLIKFIKK